MHYVQYNHLLHTLLVVSLYTWVTKIHYTRSWYSLSTKKMIPEDIKIFWIMSKLSRKVTSVALRFVQVVSNSHQCATAAAPLPLLLLSWVRAEHLRLQHYVTSRHDTAQHCCCCCCCCWLVLQALEVSTWVRRCTTTITQWQPWQIVGRVVTWAFDVLDYKVEFHE